MEVRRCHEIEDELSALLDGELDAERAAEVRAHLHGCQLCSGTLEALRDVAQRLAGLPRVAAPPELATLVERAVQREALAMPPEPRRWRVPRVALSLAAVVLLAVAVRWSLVLMGNVQSGMPTAGEPLAHAPVVNDKQPQLEKQVRSPGLATTKLRPAPAPPADAWAPPVDAGSAPAVASRNEGAGAAGSPATRNEPLAFAAPEKPQMAVSGLTGAAAGPRGAVAADAAEPVIDVVIATRDETQWVALQRVIEQVEPAGQLYHADNALSGNRQVNSKEGQASLPQAAAVQQDRAAGRPAQPVGDGFAGGVVQQSQSAGVEVVTTAARAQQVIDELERVAPEQVQVVVAGRWSQTRELTAAWRDGPPMPGEQPSEPQPGAAPPAAVASAREAPAAGIPPAVYAPEAALDADAQAARRERDSAGGRKSPATARAAPGRGARAAPAAAQAGATTADADADVAEADDLEAAGDQPPLRTYTTQPQQQERQEAPREARDDAAASSTAADLAPLADSLRTISFIGTRMAAAATDAATSIFGPWPGRPRGPEPAAPPVRLRITVLPPGGAAGETPEHPRTPRP